MEVTEVQTLKHGRQEHIEGVEGRSALLLAVRGDFQVEKVLGSNPPPVTPCLPGDVHEQGALATAGL